MLETKPLYTLTAMQVLELIKNNSVTVEEYARSLLGRIQEREDTVKAWAYLGRRSSLITLITDETIH
jgi:hypothetical protein